MTIHSYLTNQLSQALKKIKLDFSGEIKLEHPADPAHGDYATNLAMVAVGVSEFKNPRQLAEKLLANLKFDPKIIKDSQIAGPGFINFTLSEHFLLDQLSEVITNSDQLIEPIHQGKKVVVEFTDPNPFKQLHIGHLYSNTVGESLARLLTASGAQVRRANYYGDVGLHVAKSIWGMIEKLSYESEADIESGLEDLADHPLEDRTKFLGEAYALGAQSFEDSPVAKKQIEDLNKLIYVIAQDIMVTNHDWQPLANYKKHLDDEILQNWDYELIKQLYQAGKSWSLAYFDSIYQRVGMSFDNFYPESVVAEYGLKLVQDGLEKGVFKESQGAIVYEGDPKKGLHTRVFVNSVGLPTYETKELGLAPAKYQDEPYDLSIIITGNEIDEYFQVLLAAMTQLEPELGKKTTHLSHGMVKLPEGKMSSRTGEIITANWLLDEAAQRIAQLLEETKKGLSPQKRTQIAEAVGQAAIKYAFLKNSIGRDISFSFEESLSFNGNSGPYLQYTAVRCQSVLAKVKQSDLLLNSVKYSDSDLSSVEIDLLRNLFKYSEMVELAINEMAPHHLCTYLYHLAQTFNQFYTQCPILTAKGNHRQLRLALTQASAIILKNGLELLNIPTVEEM